ncbi:sarcolemmal membrane-associated protein-like isoform X2 [Gigantopelta aegis]|uniref:sarcolemmal membrane-associated protein-like isoform X2 n=1 Tax=Gigantopelta aegis TaxID=1735272 RepID=UPI001B88AD60|nr:sarcolemmal membrane-associated protein-like isoform X2 [Gigantopelta aegis]
MEEEEGKLGSSMSALAILTCRPNSHPFQERHITVDEVIKIGRSVARARPAANNAVFDCKVLSRHHAVLWYENNQFYLQDTKSSNGTFINNQRLCKGGEESPPKEVYSGDLIQFGVEVMENNRRGEKITHGCIIANITLYHPDGREAKPAPFLNTPIQPGITIQSQDLYQLAQFLQEALHRETMLQQKLAILQKLVQSTQESSEGGWQALIDEDKLLSRLEVLENQLHTYSKNHSEDALRQEIESLQKDKLSYETTAKESLRRVLQEKIEAVTKLTDLERSLTNTESECTHLKDGCEKNQEELQELAKKYQDKLQEIQDLQDKLVEAELKHADEIEECNKEKQELLSKIDEMVSEGRGLSAKIEALQADNDIAKQQSAGIKAKMASMIMNEDEEGVSFSDIIPLNSGESDDSDILKVKLKETQKQIEKYKTQIKASENKLKESNDRVEQLQKELEMVRMDSKKYSVKITSLEVQLKESRRQCESSNDLIHSLEGQIEQLEAELNLYKIPQSDKADMTLVHHDNRVSGVSALNGVPHHQTVPSTSSDDDDSKWKALLDEAREAQRRAEFELIKYKGQLQESQQTAKQSHNEAEQLRNKVKQIQEDLEKEKLEMRKKDRRETQGTMSPTGSDSVMSRQLSKSRDELEKLRVDCKKHIEKITSLEEELFDARWIRKKHTEKNFEEELKRFRKESKKHVEKNTSLKEEIEQLHRENKKYVKKIASLEDKTRKFEDALISEKRESERKDILARYSVEELHSGCDNPLSGKLLNCRAELLASKDECSKIKEECSKLKKQIQAMEAEMNILRRENLQLSSEYNKLQESHKHLKAEKMQLESSSVLTRRNLPDADDGLAATTSSGRLLAGGSGEETARLRARCKEYSEQLSRLNTEIDTMSNDYRKLSDRSKMLSFCSCIPLLMLLFAVLLALYPLLERLTATGS